MVSSNDDSDIDSSLDFEAYTLKSYGDNSFLFDYSNGPRSNYAFANSFMDVFKDGKLLDVGCGNGRDYVLFPAPAFQYTGVDPVVELVDIARDKLKGVDFKVLNALKLADERAGGFAPDYFDGFWSVCSLFHLEKKNLPNALKSISKVVKPNGYGFLMMREGDKEFMALTPFGYLLHSFYSRQELSDMIKTAGFEIVCEKLDDKEGLAVCDESVGFLEYVVKNIK